MGRVWRIDERSLCYEPSFRTRDARRFTNRLFDLFELVRIREGHAKIKLSRRKHPIESVDYRRAYVQRCEKEQTSGSECQKRER